MKIQCNYCGNMFNDTLEHCPSCGAPNPGVVRTTKSQPLTIEELAKWYADRGLPPYETTRFFIGQDYRKPRAFGIYKDPATGNFVVYKNKDSGERAIRYEGTDEAYAVNELFMRLKQEIIQQKSHNVKKQAGQNSGKSTAPRRSKVSGTSSNRYNSRGYSEKKKRSFWDWYYNLGCFGAGCFLTLVAVFGIMFVIYGIKFGISLANIPELGYYNYNGEYRYFSDWTDGIHDDGWIIYDAETDTWTGVIDRKKGPEELRKNSTAKEYFVSKQWNENIGCPNFLKSSEYLEISGNTQVKEGYYNYEGINYYHQGTSQSYGWYEYDDDDGWQQADAEELPSELKHYYQAEDFFYTPEWDSDTQITDFKDSEYYIPPSSSSSSDDNDSWWSNDYDDDDYDWDYSSGDSWDSGSTDWDSDW